MACISREAAQFRQYEQAIRTFYAQYDQYPGDFDNAYSFWAATALPPHPTATETAIILFSTTERATPIVRNIASLNI